MAQLIAMEKRILMLQAVIDKVLDILHVEPAPAASAAERPAEGSDAPRVAETPKRVSARSARPTSEAHAR